MIKDISSTDIKSLVDSIPRFMQPDYIPTNEDILYSQAKTTGITETLFPYPTQENVLQWRIFDVGGTRSERKKWVYVYEDVSLLLFTVDIGAYDQLVPLDESMNRMQEALELFKSVCNSKWFARTKILLCFTKQSKLAAKLERHPVENYFVHCQARSLEDVTQYFIDRFVSLSQDDAIYALVLKDLPQRADWEAVRSFGDWVYKGSKETFNTSGRIKKISPKEAEIRNNYLHIGRAM
jgi:hypothetical protein